MYVLRVHEQSARLEPGERAISLEHMDERGVRELAYHDAGVSLDDLAAIPLVDILERRPTGKSPKAWLREAGVSLYRRIAPEPIARVLNEDVRGPVTLDLRSPSLWSVPWELLRRPGNPRPLFSDPTHPWLCGTADPMEVTRPVADEWPLRMLVIVGSSPEEPKVQAVEESYAIEELVRGRRGGLLQPEEGTPRGSPRTRCDVLLNTLFYPELDDIERELHRFKPHVFHFIGHGRVVNGEPELRVFSKSSNGYHAWGYDQIGTAFDLDAVPRLVYLDACYSGFDDVYDWSLTDAFRDIGVSAVVSMQKQISGTTAVECARAFYSNLLGGATVAHALADARRTLISGHGEAEWYVPRLWVRGAPEHSMRVTASPSSEALANLMRCPQLDARRCFVDRWPQRYHAWRDRDAADQAGLLVVQGASGTGRTSFVHLLMESHALRGHVLHYVDFRGETGDYLDVLDRILAMRTSDGQCSFIRAPLDESAFGEYQNQRPGDASRADKALLGNIRKRLMAAFWAGLEQTARGRPLFLVLDHLDVNGFPGDVVARQIAYEFLHVYRPASTRETVRAVVVLDNEQTAFMHKQPFRHRPPCIQIDDFDDHERAYYMPLYFNWRNIGTPEAARQVQDIITRFQIACPAGFEKAEGLLQLVRRQDGHSD